MAENDPAPAPAAGLPTQNRSVVLPLLGPDDATRKAVRASIKCYRAALRKMYAAFLLGQTAGATVRLDKEQCFKDLRPHNDNAKVALAVAMGVATVGKTDSAEGETGQKFTLAVGKLPGYEMRNWFLTELYPAALSFVWDSARRDVGTAWHSRDPEFTTAARGYLALQGARQIARFNRRGIGMPPASARPKLGGDGEEGRRQLTLKWDRTIGPVTFSLPKLDGGRYHVWRALRDHDDGWSLGTVYLNCRDDGEIVAIVTYGRPARAEDVDPRRLCTVRVGAAPDDFITVAGPDGAVTYDTIGGHAADGAMRQLAARSAALALRVGDCGNPRKPWGHRRAYRGNVELRERVTAKRERVQNDYNHAWTRRIVSRAVAWRCGTLHVPLVPDDLFGHDWRWQTGFLANLKYKAAERGIVVTVGDPPAEEAPA